MTDADIPDFFRRLWRLPTAPRQRGRKSTLDVETVVATAVRLADRGGLEAATLPRVAEELDVTPTSLYRHIGSKNELLQLMMDAASEPRTPEPEDAPGWRKGLQFWAHDLRALYRDRPWLPRVPIYRAPSGPNQTAWLERGLRQLAPTGLDWPDKLAALTLLSGYIRHSALLRDELEEGRDPGQPQSESEQEYGRTLHLMVSPERFPHTCAMLSSDALGHDTAPGPGLDDRPDDESDRDFTDGLEVILDGLATQIARVSG